VVEQNGLTLNVYLKEVSTSILVNLKVDIGFKTLKSLAVKETASAIASILIFEDDASIDL
jgi:hypothetical protein